MQREGWGCLLLFAAVFLLLFELNSAVSIAQPTQSTALAPPNAVTPKVMKCYGQATVTSTTNSDTYHCGPGSETFDSSVQCGAGAVALGTEYTSAWNDPLMYCKTLCGTVSLDAANCIWR